jgi:hypothetical protein
VSAADWKAGMQARLVEHDPGTRQPFPGGKVMAATVTSVDGDHVRAVAFESGHGNSHGQSLGPIPFDLDGWIGAAGWPSPTCGGWCRARAPSRATGRGSGGADDRARHPFSTHEFRAPPGNLPGWRTPGLA